MVALLSVAGKVQPELLKQARSAHKLQTRIIPKQPQHRNPDNKGFRGQDSKG